MPPVSDAPQKESDYQTQKGSEQSGQRRPLAHCDRQSQSGRSLMVEGTDDESWDQKKQNARQGRHSEEIPQVDTPVSHDWWKGFAQICRSPIVPALSDDPIRMLPGKGELPWASLKKVEIVKPPLAAVSAPVM
jgi:hypothetical protein